MIAAISALLPGSLRSQAAALDYHRNGWTGWVRGKHQPSAPKVQEILRRVREVYDLRLEVVITADGVKVVDLEPGRGPHIGCPRCEVGAHQWDDGGTDGHPMCMLCCAREGETPEPTG